MSDPDDKTLLEFVARFAGWHEEEHPEIGPMLIGPNGEVDEPPPDYLNSVDAWLRDVWPKVIYLICAVGIGVVLFLAVGGLY